MVAKRDGSAQCARSCVPALRSSQSAAAAALCAALATASPIEDGRAMKVAIVKERRAHRAPRRGLARHGQAAWSAWVSRSSVESGAGEGACFADAAYQAAGATIAADAAAALGDADIVLKVQRPLIGGEGGEPDELRLLKRGAVADRPAGAAAEPDGRRGLRRGRDRRVRDGAGAAHHPRADDGRAVVAGQPRRLQGGARRRRRVRPRLSDDDDRRRHDQGGARAGDGRRGRRVAGDRDGAPARRDRLRRPMSAPPPRSRSRASARPLSPSTRKPPAAPRPPAAMPARWARTTSAASAKRSPRR